VIALRRLLMSDKEQRPVGSEGAISTGSTLLNLACTDRPDVGFRKSGYYFLVGDSMSGKTFLTLTCFAEACRNPEFDNYRLIYDDVEGGALMDVKRYFGSAVAKRLEPPSKVKGQAVHSDTVESFYYNIWNALEGDRPVLYVLDSQDALTSDASESKFGAKKKASEEGKESTGSYGDGKAKYHSEHLRLVLSKIRKTGSILIIIGQTRDNLGFGFNPKTRSGGRALRFYANFELWSSVLGPIERLVRKRKRHVGNKILIEVKKNRATGKVGKDRGAIINILNSVGIDDVGSCVDYLVREKHWKKVNGVINAKDINLAAKRSAIIAHIEQRRLEKTLSQTVAKVWKEIEEESNPPRKARYA